MSLKTEVVAFSSGDTVFIKQTRDMINSEWFMLNKYKTVCGYSYEQVLEWAVKTGAEEIYGGDPVILNLGSYEQYQMAQPK